jgi:general secretion pathway protein D
MIAGNKLRLLAGFLVLLLACPTPELWAKSNTKKAEKLMKLGHEAESKQEYEVALEYYSQALELNPSQPAYQLAVRRVRFQAGSVHVKNGQKLREAGQIEQALGEFQKGFLLDPSSAIALQEVRRTQEMIDRNRKGNVSGADATLTPADLERKKTLERISSMMSVPELKPITGQISTLKMNNQPPKVLYETVGKLAGINVVFDPSYQFSGKNVNLDISNTSLEEALDYVAMLTKTFWKPIGPNTIFVAEDNVTKRRDYEDQVVKVFYLRNITSVQEFQEIVTAVRSVTDIRRMFTYNAQNAVMCRGTVDQVALAEKLFHDLDKPKAEVVVDVIVMTSNSDRSRTLAAGLVSNGTTGLALSTSFSPSSGVTNGTSTGSTGTGTSTTGTTTTTGATGTTTGTTGTGTSSTSASVSLGQLGRVSFNDWQTTLPGALFQATMSDSLTRVLQSPEVRASDGQKVDLKIGEKYPYATGSFQPGVGTVGVSPLVSTQFNFADVGVNVTMTPHIHGNDEVTLHISVELSNIATTLNLGGLSQPVIATNKEETELRLRDGEVSLLGGLMQNQDQNTLAGIPGIINIPVLGNLISSNRYKDVQRNELLIAIIPHIVRTPNIEPVDLRGVAAGTDQTVKVSYQPKTEALPAPAPAAPAAPAPAAPAAPVPVVPNGPASLALVAPPAPVALSSSVVVTLEGRNIQDLFVAPLRLKWDPKLLRLDKVAPGTLIGDGGPQTNPPSIDIRNDAGEASIVLSRVAGSSGVSGSGQLATLTFVGVGKGSGTISVLDAAFKDSKQQPIAVTAPNIAITVQ